MNNDLECPGYWDMECEECGEVIEDGYFQNKGMKPWKCLDCLEED